MANMISAIILRIWDDGQPKTLAIGNKTLSSSRALIRIAIITIQAGSFAFETRVVH